MIEINKISNPWSKLNSQDFDSWHTMCSYLGAFPPSLAHYFIQYFSEKGDIIFDPFSGRGTTALEARLMNRRSISTDINPIALALCEAKNYNLNKIDILTRIDDLEKKYDYALYQPEAKAQPDTIHLIFHPRTLSQLCYLKRRLLNSDNPIDKYLIGATLGILHGGERANGTSGYASIDMPNTFSMSPEYVRRFVQTNQLNRTFHNVFTLLREKIERLFKKHTPLENEGYVFNANVRSLKKNVKLKTFKNKVKLILSSPPYLGIVNYAKQNWIRSWFLNQDINELSEKLDDNLNLDKWLVFSKIFIEQLKFFLLNDGVIILVIGDVAKSKNSIIPLAREFCLMIRENKIFKNIWCISDSIEETNKTTKIWGETKGSATVTDRIVILSNLNPFEVHSDKNEIIPLNFSVVEESTRLFLGK